MGVYFPNFFVDPEMAYLIRESCSDMVTSYATFAEISNIT
jgi:hypothetical protein